ncbi:MAG: DUF4097 domain-containing protein [Gemmatimonadetes bacterium]|nr:DUF4097 domain-containing protein [Gemmatimonadota bacterium]
MRGLKVAALFMGYGLVGLGGDYAVGLLAQNHTPAHSVRVRVREPAVRMRVQVRGSGDCRYEAERTVQVDASASQRLQLDAGSGALRVVGVEGLKEVRAVGHACASDEEYLKDLQVTVEDHAGRLALETHYPSHRGIGWRGEDYARIDLTVEVPKGMSVDLSDSSGDLEVSGTGALNIDDSSGSIRVRDIDGSVNVDDSSGEIDVSGVAGDVNIEDGSGGIGIRDVQGSVRLDDGSGGIEVAGVGRNVTVADDGSGSIEVRDVKGDFTVRSDGSGGIRYSGVEGTVSIPRDKQEGRHRHGG